LGAQTKSDLKSERFIVNGEHDANKLQDILDGFIRKFVLCPSCDNPETTLKVRRQAIHSKCKACGHAFTIDSKHKIATFILKNPPPSEGSDDGKEEKRASPTEEVGLNGGEIEANGKASSIEAVDDDDDWVPEPVAAEDKLSAQIGKLVIDRDLEKSTEDRLDMLHHYFVKANDSGTLGDGKHLVNEAERLELKDKAPVLLAQVLFTKDIINELKAHRTLFLRFCLNDKKAQRCLLGGIEQFLDKNPDLMPRAAHLLKALYDLDLCEEETILSWATKPSSKFVSKDCARQIIKQCDPIIKWLQEAEEETETDEDDEIEFNERSRVIGTVVEKKPIATTNGTAKAPTVATDLNGEELDIDDI